jgi:hypothetical protein
MPRTDNLHELPTDLPVPACVSARQECGRSDRLAGGTPRIRRNGVKRPAERYPIEPELPRPRGLRLDWAGLGFPAGWLRRSATTVRHTSRHAGRDEG